MLQFIRDHLKGAISIALLVFVGIPFAFFGLGQYGGAGAGTAAKVNGTRIPESLLDQDVDQERRQLVQQFGPEAAQTFPAEILRGQVLDRIIERELLQQLAFAGGLGGGEAVIRHALERESAFQDAEGRFDPQRYQDLLKASGLSPQGYEQDLARSGRLTALVAALTLSEPAVGVEGALWQRFAGQYRDLRLYQLPNGAEGAGGPVVAEVTEAEIEAAYQAEPARYQSPERVRVSYVRLPAATLEVPEPTEAELRARFEAESGQFARAERRRARHILLPVDAAAEGEGRAEAERVRARLLQGESFADLARSLSQDPGSAVAGGDLGEVTRGMMVPEFEQALFALQVGEVSRPVRTQFGWHLLEVLEIIPASTPPFETVQAQLRDEALDAARADALAASISRLDELAYDHPDSLDAVAQAFSLAVEESEWMTRSAGEGVFTDEALRQAAFTPEVLEEGQNSAVVQLEDAAVVLRLAARETAQTRPLAEVREVIRTRLQQQRVEEALDQRLAGLLEAVRAGMEDGVLRERFPELQLETRSLSLSDADAPAELLRAAFALAPPPAGGEAAVAAESLALQDGSRVVLRLDAVKLADGETGTAEAEGSDSAQAMELAQQLAATRADEALEALLTQARAEARIRIRAPAPGEGG